jgi:hypothetical protein
MDEPHHRTALAFVIDKSELVLQVLAPMQIEEFRRALGVVAGQWVRCNIIDSGVANPDFAAIVQCFEILFAGSQHIILLGLNVAALWRSMKLQPA